MARYNFSSARIFAILHDHVSRLSIQEIVLLHLSLLAELLKRFSDWVLGVTFFWLTAWLQS